MKSIVISNLLSLASFYEKRANNYNILIFAEEVAELQFTETLEHLLLAAPSSQEWKNWFAANATILGQLPITSKVWSIGNSYYIYCHLSTSPQEVGVFVGTKSTSPYPGEIKSFGIINAVGTIPALWFFTINMDSDYDRDKKIVSKSIAHENWLHQSFEYLFQDVDEDQLIQFINSNKSTIDKIRASFTVSAPKYLGGGSDGVAFDIGDRILKIFKDETSFIKAKEAFNRLHTNSKLAKTEAMIYDVGKLGNYKKKSFYDDSYREVSIYYYIMEIMKPLMEILDEDELEKIRGVLTETVREIYSERHTKWRELKKMISDPSKSNAINEIVKNESYKIVNNFSSPLKEDIKSIEKSIPSLEDNWAELYVEEIIMKYLTGRTDLHMGNLGLTHYGELRYYDPAYTDWESKINGAPGASNFNA